MNLLKNYPCSSPKRKTNLGPVESSWQSKTPSQDAHSFPSLQFKDPGRAILRGRAQLPRRQAQEREHGAGAETQGTWPLKNFWSPSDFIQIGTCGETIWKKTRKEQQRNIKKQNLDSMPTRILASDEKSCNCLEFPKSTPKWVDMSWNMLKSPFPTCSVTGVQFAASKHQRALREGALLPFNI